MLLKLFIALQFLKDSGFCVNLEIEIKEIITYNNN